MAILCLHNTLEMLPHFNCLIGFYKQHPPLSYHVDE